MLFSYFPITSTVHQNVEKYELTDRKTSIVFVVKLILRANPAEKKTDVLNFKFKYIKKISLTL